jgi:hypothetical protein
MFSGLVVSFLDAFSKGDLFVSRQKRDFVDFS